MALQTSGQVRVDVNRVAAFEFVRDPMSLAACIPGCKDLQEVSPGIYSAVLTNEVAFITLRFKVRVEVIRIEAPDTIEAKITGETIGLAGRVTANAALRLAEIGPTQTEIRYTSNVSLAGKLGGLGEPVFRAKSAEVSKQFGANLRTAIEQVATSGGANAR
jgi:carbon monoxide dehydrogenase subunit G